MTPEEKEQYKEEVREALFEYLELNGLMNAPNGLIMMHIPEMYMHLESVGLVKHGLTFELFHTFAQQEYIFAQIKDDF